MRRLAKKIKKQRKLHYNFQAALQTLHSEKKTEIKTYSIEANSRSYSMNKPISLHTNFHKHHQAWFLLLDTFFVDHMCGSSQMASLPTSCRLCCSDRQSWSKSVSCLSSSKCSHTSPVHTLCTWCPPRVFGLDDDTPMKLANKFDSNSKQFRFLEMLL